MLRRKLIVFGVVLLGLVLLLGLAAEAGGKGRGGKKPPPTPPPGVIFFRADDPALGSTWVMLADGSAKRLLGGGYMEDVTQTEPRWFLRRPAVAPETTDGTCDRILNAVHETDLDIPSEWIPLVEGDATSCLQINGVKWSFPVGASREAQVAYSYREWKWNGSEWVKTGGRGINVVEVLWVGDVPSAGGTTTVVNEVDIPHVYFDSVTWEPGNERLAFVTSATIGTSDDTLWTVKPDGSAKLELIEMPSLFSVDWSPDGARIAFAAGSPDRRIFTIKPDGKELFQVTTSRKNDHTGPSWSPDSQQIAYNRFRLAGLVIDVYRINADGTGKGKKLTEGSFPRWR